MRDYADLSLKIISTHENSYKIISFKKGYVDKGMIDYAKEHPRAVIATLDYTLKQQIRNPIMVIRRKKQLEIV